VGLPKQRLPAWPTLLRLLLLQGLFKNDVATCLVCRSRYALLTLAARSPVFRLFPTLFGSTRMRPLVQFRSSSGLSPNHSSLRLSASGNSPGTSRPFGASVPGESTHPRDPTPSVPCRVQGFSPSSRSTPPRGLVGLFRPTNALRFRPSRVSPPGEGGQLVADP
jgi:hypothetical protein